MNSQNKLSYKKELQGKLKPYKLRYPNPSSIPYNRVLTEDSSILGPGYYDPSYQLQEKQSKFATLDKSRYPEGQKNMKKKIESTLNNIIGAHTQKKNYVTDKILDDLQYLID